MRLLKLPDGSLQVLLQGAERIQLGGEATQTTPYLRADIVVLPSQPDDGPITIEIEGLVKNLQALFTRVVQLSPVLPDEMASPRPISTNPAAWPISSPPTSTWTRCSASRPSKSSTRPVRARKSK